MAQITIYTTPTCPFCHRAKYLLDQKKAAYTEIDVSQSNALREEMMQRSGRRTVPQIFIDDFHVGGCDDLIDLNLDGKLDPLLKS
ncbi:glutaredoxin 3 [Nitrincola tapanii]|uniref:Glutaredoxin n=1 Tax=Nitrincola tapanii TaxID=1708751 RepID=A0A5A9W313_9GAMM|nr:glutaredoxin 3 [Nitrincola tapanii]KAA0874508.1 glutaredoxin 3 [Nitrincola tapanii]